MAGKSVTSNSWLLAVCLGASGLLATHTDAGVVVLSALKDAPLVSSSGNNNFGAATLLATGKISSGAERSVLQFDTAPLTGKVSNPTDVTAITLRLFFLTFDGPSNKTTQVFQVTDADAGWVEGNGSNIGTPTVDGDVTWNKKARGTPGVSWAGSAGLSTAGTDYVNTVLASRSFTASTAPAAGAAVDFVFTGTPTQLTTLIQHWMTVTNAGLLLLDPNQGSLQTLAGGDRLQYSSKNTATVTLRPLLLVTVPEPAAACLLGGPMLLLLSRRRTSRR